MTQDYQTAKDELDAAAEKLRRRQRWVHNKSGGSYIAMGVAFEESSLTPVVVYESDVGGPMWTRPAAEFFDRFEGRV